MDRSGTNSHNSDIQFTVAVKISDVEVVKDLEETKEWPTANVCEGAGTRSQQHCIRIGIWNYRYDVSFRVVVDVRCFNRGERRTNRNSWRCQSIDWESTSAVVDKDRNASVCRFSNSEIQLAVTIKICCRNRDQLHVSETTQRLPREQSGSIPQRYFDARTTRVLYASETRTNNGKVLLTIIIEISSDHIAHSRCVRVVSESIVKCAGPITVKNSDAGRLTGCEIYFAVLIEVTKNRSGETKTENHSARNIRLTSGEISSSISQHDRNTALSERHHIDVSVVVNISRQRRHEILRKLGNDGG